MPDNRPLPFSGQDVQQVQDVGIMDKFGMVRQGLDASNPDHVRKYMASKQGMSNGGVVVPQQPSVAARPMGPAPLQQPAPQVAQSPNAMQLAALQRLRGF